MNYRDIDLAEGQRAVFNVTVTAPAGTDTTLTGGVTVRAEDGTETDYRMTAEGTQLTAGALPVGRWVYEIRAGGRTVVYGFLVVHPSPLAPDNGESVWQITGDLGTAEVQIELADGLRGDVTPEAEQARIDAQAAAEAAETAGSAAETARISALNAAAAATSAADRAAQQATEAGTAATAAAGAADDAAAAQTAAESAKTSAETAQGAAETARDVAVQAAAVYDTHVATMASTGTAGHVKLGTDTAQSSSSAPVGLTAAGQMVVPMATMTTFGTVKKSSQTGTSIPCIGITNGGAMVLNVRATHSGFEQSNNTIYIQTGTTDHPTNGAAETAPVATDTAGKLAIPPASTTRAGGVILATGADDTRATAVITAAQFAALVARVEALETAAAAATE